MSITPSMPDDHEVRWCLAQTCQQAISIFHLNPDAENECRACGHADPKACVPWLWAVMKVNQQIIGCIDLELHVEDMRLDLERLQTLEDIEDLCRKLEVLND